MGYKKSATKKNKEKKAARKPIIRVATGLPHTGDRTDPAGIRLAIALNCGRAGATTHLNSDVGRLLGVVEEKGAKKPKK